MIYIKKNKFNNTIKKYKVNEWGVVDIFEKIAEYAGSKYHPPSSR